ncbi:kinase-like protein, partial [Marasmius fiardii PR-910]
NVLVDAQGQCHLADFGLATVAMTSSLFGSTTSGIGKGTTRWMAPASEESKMFSTEPWDQDSENTKPHGTRLASDIYAYACTVYEILAGEVPFAHLKVDAQVILKVINGERPKRPTEVRWCPDNIWALVEQCWAQESHLRPTAAVIHSFLMHLERLHTTGLPWIIDGGTKVPPSSSFREKFDASAFGSYY